MHSRALATDNNLWDSIFEYCPQIFLFYFYLGVLMTNQNNTKEALKVSFTAIIFNIILSILKFTAGFFGNSAAMISDAVHTLSDLLSTIVVIVGVKLASREDDDDHQYGHERFECVAGIILATMLFITGVGIVYSAFLNIFSGNYQTAEIPGTIALIAAVISILMQEFLFQYTKRVAKKVGSGALMADAWHHRSDALSSVGSFIGIFGAMLGFVVLDSLVAVIIGGVIVKVAYSIFKDSIDKMTDKACEPQTVDKIMGIAKSCDGVLKVDMLKTRVFANKIYIDIEITVDSNLTLHKAHEIAEAVHDKIEIAIQEVKHCMVHVNPD